MELASVAFANVAIASVGLASLRQVRVIPSLTGSADSRALGLRGTATLRARVV